MKSIYIYSNTSITVNTACIMCISVGGGSCSGRCGQSLNPAETCQCNTDCLRFGDCCPNYQSMCTDSGPDSGTPSPNPGKQIRGACSSAPKQCCSS